jgi:signal transduction histidine kinase
MLCAFAAAALLLGVPTGCARLAAGVIWVVAVILTYARIDGWTVVPLVLWLVAGQYAVRASQELERLRRDGRILSDRLIEERERERLRIASELHAGLLQDLAALMHDAENLAVAVIGRDETGALARASTLWRTANHSSSVVRDAIANARRITIDADGLAPTVHHFAAVFGRRTDIRVVVHSSGIDGIRLPSTTAQLVYECFQEALTNVGRHARASAARVELSHKGAVVELCVQDNGVGRRDDADADRERPRLGLQLTRDRLALVGGACWIDSSRRGTRFVVRVPINDL